MQQYEQAESNYFVVADWALFVTFVIASLLIGIVLGFRRKQSASDYVLAERNMGAFTIAASLVASFWSAIAILGYSAESYFYGTQFWMTCIGNVLSTIATAHFFIPKLRSCGIDSLYDYLRLRFNVHVKTAASICFICQTTLYMGVVIFAPSQALNQVTGLNVWLPASILTVVCMIYSTLGGIRGVVWTDTFQFSVILIGLLLTATIGSHKVGGFWKVLATNIEYNRLELFNINPDPRVRVTLWSCVIGQTFTTLSLYSFNQMQVQRYFTLKSDKLCKRAAWLNCLGVVISITLCMIIGLIMFDYYNGCDPLLSGRIRRIDQLYPLFIMDTMKKLPGFGGLFLATIFSGTLSTVSSCLNSQSAVIVDDLIKPLFLRLNFKFNHYLVLLRTITFIFGCIALLMMFILQRIPFLLQAALSIFGVFNGPVMGVFLLGMLFKFTTSLAALLGLLVSVTFQVWILAGSIQFGNDLKSPFKPLTDKFCTNDTMNLSIISPVSSTVANFVTDTSGIVSMYGMSFLWHGLSGCLICVIIGLLASVIDSLFFHTHSNDALNYDLVFDWMNGMGSLVSKLVKRTSKKEEVICLDE